MSKPVIFMLLVVVAMMIVNVINIPRGPLLHCYENVTTYTARQASYGFPFVFMHGNIKGDECNLVSGEISDQTYKIQPYNDYHVDQRALVLNAGITVLLAGAAYFAGVRVTRWKIPSSKKARRNA